MVRTMGVEPIPPFEERILRSDARVPTHRVGCVSAPFAAPLRPYSSQFVLHSIDWLGPDLGPRRTPAALLAQNRLDRPRSRIITRSKLMRINGKRNARRGMA